MDATLDGVDGDRHACCLADLARYDGWMDGDMEGVGYVVRSHIFRGEW